ncbi:coiled-coil domain-containing protein 138 isoform X2 [Nematostella vectensis]|nr:coiled-coil domain-containing protein 138 isoform X2 [Nematostella vectensis]
MKFGNSKSRKSFHEMYPSASDVDVKKIYRELMQINSKLQRENAALQEREQRLRERERNLREAEQLSETTDVVIDKIVDNEVEARVREITQSYDDQIFVLEEELKGRTVELKRVRDSFNTIKTANDNLKKQLTELQEQNRVLEAQAISVQHRLANLQRKSEFASRQVTSEEKQIQQDRYNKDTTKSRPASRPDSNKAVSFTLNKFNFSGTLDVLAVLLEWIAEAHLRSPPTFQETLEGSLQEQVLDFTSALVHEKCLKILPAMADILTYLPAVNLRVQEPCLQFTYWCILYMEKSVTGSQRTTLASTFRHIGENLYKPQPIRFTEDGLVTGLSRTDRGKSDLYFHSPNLGVRLLSSLIILKTLSQVDHLAHVFDVLKNDLRDDMGKQLFLTFEGVNVILPYMKPAQKALLNSSIDVMLQMSMDSPFLQAFLESCCNEPWFRACVALLQFKGTGVKAIEKLSIVLQRLSKNKGNRRYFEAFQIQPIIQELLRNSDPGNAFLALNLRSIVFNLGGKT